MRHTLLLAVVLCSPSWLGALAATPVSEEDKGTGFSDIASAAAVGAGVVARSSDGGRTFHIEPTPDRVMAYAIAFSRGELLLFDVKGRGFRSPRPGAGFQPLELPRAIRFWTASFSGVRGAACLPALLPG